MANLQSLTVNDIGNLTLPSGTSSNRPSLYSSTAIKWTNTGTQAYTVISGTTPTLTSTSWTAPAGVTSIEVLVVAGGGSGAAGWGGGAGGGGAGGLIYNSSYAVTPGTSYTVTVGLGGTPVNGTVSGNTGGNSVFGTLTALGGGGGGTNGVAGQPGGSGGGSGEYPTSYSNPTQAAYGLGGAGTLGQGYKGGDCNQIGVAGGGGGSGGAGTNSSSGGPGVGGPGLNYSITGTPTWYAGGGGSSGNNLPGSPGGSGIGGNGGPGSGGTGTVTSGTASTGSGGGGTYQTGAGTASGGSGIVVIRYSLATASTQPVGQVRFNTDVNKIEHFGSNNVWTVTDGPLLNLDVGNTSSYSGSGTSWNDLANGNTFTLVNSPTYGGSGAGAYLSFNGSTQYAQAAQLIDFTSSIFTQGFTLETWCYPTGVQGSGNSIMFSTAGGTSGPQWQNYIWYNTSNYFGTTQRYYNNFGGSPDQNDFNSTFTSPINNWYHVVASCNNQHTTLYVNGVQAAANRAGQPYATPFIAFTNSGSLATRVSGFVGYNLFVGRIAVVKVYNRPITPDEVLQNFNALRGRYGV